MAYIPNLLTRRAADYTGVIGEEPYRFGGEQWENPLQPPTCPQRHPLGSRWTARREVEAPEGVAVELLTQPDGTLLLHLLNYKLDAPVPEAKSACACPLANA